MATEDVPGANPANGDSLHAGCWAEHQDGSLVFVKGAEGPVTYEMFDIAEDPIVVYTDRMPTKEFEKAFSWGKTGNKSGVKWTWHNRTPFPWDRVIKKGAKGGVQPVSADDQISAAKKVAASLKLRAGKALEEADFSGRLEKVVDNIQKEFGKLKDLLGNNPET